MLIKMAIIVAIVLIGGTLMVNPDVDAAPGNQGTPFESVWNAIDNLGQTLGTIPCEDGQVVKWYDASGEWKCAYDNGAAQLNVLTVEGNVIFANTIGAKYISIAECPAGTTLTGGGYRFYGFSNTIEGIMIDNRQINDQDWRARFAYTGGTGTYTFVATAMCASITP